MTIDTSKLSKALRVGGLGIWAEAEPAYGNDVASKIFLPDGTGLGVRTNTSIRDVPHELSLGLVKGDTYQTWLTRAKCRHVWPFRESGGDGSEICEICEARRDAVALGHYTLLPEDPADRLCAVPGCIERARKGRHLCEPCASDYFMFAATGEAPEVWAARQSKGGGSINCAVPGCGKAVGEPGNKTYSLGVLCADHSADWMEYPGRIGRQKLGGYYIPSVLAWAAKQPEGGDATSAVPKQSGAPIAGPGDEPGSVFDYFAAKDGTFSNVLTDPPAPSKECLDRAIGELKDYMSEPRPPCQRCNAPLTRRTSAGAYCYYCVHQSRLVAECKESLDRPLPERIQDAQSRLGYHDGYGVYSLPGDAK